jgi:hypothetical protein
LASGALIVTVKGDVASVGMLTWPSNIAHLLHTSPRTHLVSSVPGVAVLLLTRLVQWYLTVTPLTVNGYKTTASLA